MPILFGQVVGDSLVLAAWPPPAEAGASPGPLSLRPAEGAGSI